MKQVLIVSAAMVFTFTALATSVVNASEARERQLRQRARIHHGIHNGTLVGHEARRLAVEQRAIRKAGRRMMANDGKLGRVERKRLDRMQDRASHHIFFAKHNARTR